MRGAILISSLIRTGNRHCARLNNSLNVVSSFGWNIGVGNRRAATS